MHLNPQPSLQDLDPLSQTICKTISRQMGSLPNFYRFMGYSSNALKSYLAFNISHNYNHFTARERVAVGLSVSEENQSDYCLAVHSMVAKLNDFTAEEIHSLKQGKSSDNRLQILSTLSRTIAHSKASIDPKELDEFLTHGFNPSHLIDLLALIADITYTNYMFKIGRYPIDFPQK